MLVITACNTLSSETKVPNKYTGRLYKPKTKLSGLKTCPKGPDRTESIVPGSRSMRMARGTYFPPLCTNNNVQQTDNRNYTNDNIHIHHQSGAPILHLAYYASPPCAYVARFFSPAQDLCSMVSSPAQSGAVPQPSKGFLTFLVLRMPLLTLIHSSFFCGYAAKSP